MAYDTDADADGDCESSDSWCSCCAMRIEEQQQNDQQNAKERTTADLDVDPDIEVKREDSNSEPPSGENGSKTCPSQSQSIADIHILATIFEYPYITRDEHTVFEMETQEFPMCKKCDSALSELYPLYLTFTELLQQQGKIWKTLQKIGKDQEPILPMCVYRDDDDVTIELNDSTSEKGSNFNNFNSSKSRKQRHRRRKASPKRYDLCLTGSETEGNNDYHYQERVSPKRKPKKKRNSNSTSNSNKRTKVQYSYSSDQDDNNTFDELTEPERPGNLTDDDFEILSVIGETAGDKSKESSEAFQNLQESASDFLDGVESIPNTGEDSNGDPTKPRITRRLRGRSVQLKESSEESEPSKHKDFRSFVRGVHKRAKAMKDAKAKRSKDKASKKPKVKKPRIRNRASEKGKKDNRKRTMASRLAGMSEEKKNDPSRNCDICGKFFLYPTLLNNHKRTVHEGQKPFKCNECGKGFTQDFILRKHKCDYSLLPEGEREFLIMERENKLKCFICEVCGQRFKGNAQLQVHRQNHINQDRPFKCEKCPKTFRRQDHLSKHYKVVHTEGQRHVCSICGQTFKVRSSLSAHEKRHVLPKEIHVCTICGKSYDNLLAVKRHQGTHDDSLAFPCEVCGKRFKTKDYLGQHLRKGKSCKPGMPPRVPHQSVFLDPNNFTKNESSSTITKEPSSSTGAGSSAAMTMSNNASFASTSEPPKAPDHISNIGPHMNFPLAYVMENPYSLFGNRPSLPEF